MSTDKDQIVEEEIAGIMEQAGIYSLNGSSRAVEQRDFNALKRVVEAMLRVLTPEEREAVYQNLKL